MFVWKYYTNFLLTKFYLNSDLCRFHSPAFVKKVTLIMVQNQKEFCFCTLALGKKYCSLAVELAKDIERYSPKTSFVVLTNIPDEVSNCINVLAFQHRQRGVYPYHDKSFVIKKALSLFNSCIFIDADMRILGEVPEDLQCPPGITARSGTSIIQHNKNRIQHFTVIKKISQKLNLALENVKFVHEFLFIVTKSSGSEIEFIQQWEIIAPYFELNGVYGAEGNAIGLAAAKAGFPVRFDSRDRFPFFKDRIERVKISKGQAEPNEKLVYFETQQRLEYPVSSLMNKIVSKLNKNICYVYRTLRLRIVTLKRFHFYYW